MGEFEVRLSEPEDLNFIFATWLRSYRYSSSFAKRISNDTFYTWHHKVIERILGRGALISVVCPKGDPSVILGYACAEMYEGKPVIHFIYVKKAFRKMGAAKELLKDINEGLFTHWTQDSEWIVKKYPKFMYNPYLI